MQYTKGYLGQIGNTYIKWYNGTINLKPPVGAKRVKGDGERFVVCPYWKI